MILITALIFLGFFLLLHLAFNKSRIKQVNLPGPWILPLVGSALELDKIMWVTLNKWSRKYGPMCKAKLGPMDIVLVSDNKIAKEMLAMDAFLGKTFLDEFLLFEGDNSGLIFSEGEVWEEQRRFVLRQLRDFGFGKSSMESIMMEEVNELIERFCERKGEPVENIKNEFSMALINSLWSIVAGTRYSQEDPKLRRLHKQIQGAFDDASEAGALLPVAPWLKYLIPEWSGYNTIRRAMKSLSEFVGNTIQEHKRTFQPDHTRDFIDMYLTEIEKTTDPTSSFYRDMGERQLINVVADLFSAGTDTTSTTMDWAILHLIDQPHIQKKLQEEIDSITEGCRQVSFADRPNMPYAQALINELLRISIVPFGAPHRVLFDTEYRGVFFPKGISIFINMHHIHHDPKHWDEPNSFKPERFLTDDGKSLKKIENFNPFLVGRRQCPGETLARDLAFLFLTNIVQKFDILPDPNCPRIDLEPAVNFMVQAKPYRAVFQERNQ